MITKNLSKINKNKVKNNSKLKTHIAKNTSLAFLFHLCSKIKYSKLSSYLKGFNVKSPSKTNDLFFLNLNLLFSWLFLFFLNKKYYKYMNISFKCKFIESINIKNKDV